MISSIEKKCLEKGIKMTEQRKVIARVLSNSNDHPDVEEVHKRASDIDPNISITTVYRAVRLLEEENIVEKHDFGDGKARYEKSDSEHHDHIIDVRTGKIIEFMNEDIERLQHEIADKHGYRLIDHRLELYVVPKDEA